jgi:Protein of unknown function (DUF2877)
VTTALRVATPVLGRARGRGRILGRHPTSAYISFDGFVVALTTPQVPMMPNGVISETLPRLAPDEPVFGGAGVIRIGATTIELRASDRWNPAVIRLSPERALGRAADLWDAVPMPEHPAAGALLRAVAAADESAMRAELGALIGWGGGLTPEGDDFVSGVAIALRALGGRLDLPDDLASRTTALSATLLALAADGLAAEPLHDLLDADVPAGEAVERLARIGHSTGRAWAAGCALGLRAYLSRAATASRASGRTE